MRFFRPNKIMKWSCPGALWRMPGNEKTLYLTFDDGPDPAVTRWILEKLDKYNAKATFFCIGEKVVQRPDIFNEIMERGHSVGNHTYLHRNGWKTGFRSYIKDVEKAGEFINSELFRPPYGRISPLQLKFLKRKYKVIMWSFLTYDFDPDLNCKYVLRKMKKELTPGDIIVFHDTKRCYQNMSYLLNGILEEFSARGYKFTSIDTTFTNSKSIIPDEASFLK